MASFRISSNYWQSLTPLQQRYFQTWVGEYMTVSDCKAVLSACKKQRLKVVAYRGNKVKTEGGRMYQYSGSDRKLMLEVQPDIMEILNLKSWVE